jgi:3-deoxy-D-manno-octulosonic-acid transferase
MAARDRDPRLPIALSTTTRTGADIAGRMLDGLYDARFFFPWDIPRILRRFLDGLRPRAFATMETEIWPNLLYELHRRGIPSYLVNARLSETTFAKIMKRPSFWRPVFGWFRAILARGEGDVERFLAVGAPADRIRIIGDCKIDALLERRRLFDETAARKMVPAGRGPVFLAGSTHRGEEEIVLDAFARLRADHPDARLVIVPRHPERGDEVRALASPFGSVSLLSRESDAWDILVVDRIGVLFDLYGAADAAFIGGSLVPKGGQNLMEAAAFGLPICHGPDMEDFPEAARRLGDLGVATEVADAASLASRWRESLSAAVRDTAREGCRRYFRDLGGASERAWSTIRSGFEGDLRS